MSHKFGRLSYADYSNQELKRVMRQALSREARCAAYGALINRKAFKRGK